MIDRAAFFAGVRQSFGKLKHAQVNGINAVLDAWTGADPRHTCYALATTWHETAKTMMPIREFGSTAYFTRMYDIEGERPGVAKALGNILPGDGAKYCGRGYVQITGRNNYAKASSAIGFDFLADPSAALNEMFAAKIMTSGMKEGWFTGKKISDYFNDRVNDPRNARKVINGLDKADLIAGYYAQFLAAYEGAMKPLHRVPPPPPDIPTVTPRPPAKGLWARIRSLWS
jgi:putative chitinase